MSKVAIVSYDVQTLNGRAGGIGTFVTQWARLLKEQGEDVAIVLVRGETDAITVDPRWRETYRAWGIDLVEIHNKPARRNRWPEIWPVRLSEQVAPVLRAFDVAYFCDGLNPAFHTVRTKRFTTAAMPVCVTVLHGPTIYERHAGREYLSIPGDLHFDYVERYSALHSDYVAAPSRYMRDWLKQNGWRFREEPEVLWLPYRPEGSPGPERRAQELKRLVFFGRLQKRKGYVPSWRRYACWPPNRGRF
jgi:glycosyltransferase involved in cell wall biosynthesis